MASLMTPTRALDIINDHNLSASSALPSTTQERGAQGELVKTTQVQEAQERTLRYASSVEVGATTEASAQADQFLAAEVTAGAGDGERMLGVFVFASSSRQEPQPQETFDKATRA
ncbi:hypothetical protein MRX96_032144 [Rhipicephalus microplus]